MQTADKILIKIPDQLYVGIQGKKEFNTENPPLGFAIPYAESGPFKKNYDGSKETVDKWAGYRQSHGTYNYTTQPATYTPPPAQTEHGVVIDNEFREGFYFEKSVSRYETNNKFFRINDPLGFQLEIDAANLGDILLNSHISKGYLVGKFRWARYQGKAYLVREDHPSVNPEEKVKEKRTNPKVGDVVVFGNDATTKYVYCGKFNVLSLGTKVTRRHRETRELLTSLPPLSYTHYNYQAQQTAHAQLEAQYEHVATEYYKREDDRYNVYQMLGTQSYKTAKYDRSYLFYKGYGAITIVEENHEYKVPELEKDAIFFNDNGSGYGLNRAILFKDKKALTNFDIATLDIYEQFAASRQESRDQYERYRGSYNNQPTPRGYQELEVVQRIELQKGEFPGY